MVVHFAPKVRQWIIPEPDLSKEGIYTALRTPFVGINIIEDIERQGLEWILSRMMQVAGVPVSNALFRMQPDLLTSIAIHKAWMRLELPMAGIDALRIHMSSLLMLGDPVTLPEMQGLWVIERPGSAMLKEMGHNFVHSYLSSCYSGTLFTEIRNWYRESKERRTFFIDLERRNPKLKIVQRRARRSSSDSTRDSASRHAYQNGEPDKSVNKGAVGIKSSKGTDLEEIPTTDLSLMQLSMGRGKRRSHERLRSIEGVMSGQAVRNTSAGRTRHMPVNTPPAPPYSQPVDSSELADILNTLSANEGRKRAVCTNPDISKSDLTLVDMSRPQMPGSHQGSKDTGR